MTLFILPLEKFFWTLYNQFAGIEREKRSRRDKITASWRPGFREQNGWRVWQQRAGK
jgi:hypothetical protein